MERSLVRSVGRLIFGRLLPRIPYPVLQGPLRGAFVVLGSAAGEGGGASVYFGRVETAQMMALSSILAAGGSFFDVGANVGIYSLLGSRLVGPAGIVLAFEPVPRNLEYLSRHVRLNRLENVVVVPVACASSSGLVAFSAGENFATGHISAVGAAPRDGSRAVPTPSARLDDVVQLTGILPDAMKIDVEGAEALVLQGSLDLIRSGRPSILLSIHSAALRDECLGVLGAEGYSCSGIDGALEEATEILAIHPKRRPGGRLGSPERDQREKRSS